MRFRQTTFVLALITIAIYSCAKIPHEPLGNAQQSELDFENNFFMQAMAQQRKLLAQAERDSIFVKDEDVEATLNNHIDYFAQLYGSRAKLEQVTGKTISQIKAENRVTLKEQMIVEKEINHLLEKQKITQRK